MEVKQRELEARIVAIEQMRPLRSCSGITSESVSEKGVYRDVSACFTGAC